MAQFIASIDASPQRREAVATRAKALLSEHFGVAADVIQHQELALVSVTQCWEPFHQRHSSEGIGCIWGNAMERDGNIAHPPNLLACWRDMTRVPAPLEGIHVAMLHRADGSWTVGADPLGVTPVYYYCGNDFWLVSSSPELMRIHPSFPDKLDPVGLAGLLLVNGLVGGRALLQGVRRLAPGTLLHGLPRQAPQAIKQYSPRVSDDYFGASFEQNFARMEEVLEQCLQRHLSAEKYGLILSGGLDSRLMAGLLTRRKADVRAYSFGDHGDLEVRCATSVARTLKLPQDIVPVRADNYLHYALKESKWKHLANGFNTLMFHEPLPESAASLRGMLSGYAKEAIVAGDHIVWAGDDPERMSFDNFFRVMNRWALNPGDVKELLRELIEPGAVDALVDELRQAYDAPQCPEFQKAYLFGHFHRGRFHTSAVLGLHSHWPWPIVPYLDTRMLDLIGGMPYEHMRHRRMQYHMLRVRFPELARLPLDRNGFNTRPVLPRFNRYAEYAWHKLLSSGRGAVSRVRDGRFYYRVMDFNSAGWRLVRAAAEKHRTQAALHLNAATLARLLPRPMPRSWPRTPSVMRPRRGC